MLTSDSKAAEREAQRRRRVFRSVTTSFTLCMVLATFTLANLIPQDAVLFSIIGGGAWFCGVSLFYWKLLVWRFPKKE